MRNFIDIIETIDWKNEFKKGDPRYGIWHNDAEWYSEVSEKAGLALRSLIKYLEASPEFKVKAVSLSS